MALVMEALMELLQRTSATSIFTELILLLGPLWIAVMVGLVLGWAWKPKWISCGRKMSGRSDLSSNLLPFFLFQDDNFEVPSGEESILSGNLFRKQLPSYKVGASTNSYLEVDARVSNPCSSQMETSGAIISKEALDHLRKLVEGRDGGPAWVSIMDRSTAKMSYQAWRRDPPTGPPQYRSRTVFEDVTPELVRDFFWDDEFRPKWDDMLIYSTVLEECPTTGMMVVKWIRKFPFFCSDREYIIGRRIWEAGRSYYCVTKGVPYTSAPRTDKLRRVDLYYSSWCIRAVESKRRDVQVTACEVLLFHYEDMGIPREIAKLGVRQGMWGAVKKIEPGLQAYKLVRQSGAPLSKFALGAQINSKVNDDYFLDLGKTADGSATAEVSASVERDWGRNISRLLIVGGAVMLAFSLDRGLLTKAVIFRVARRMGKLI